MFNVIMKFMMTLNIKGGVMVHDMNHHPTCIRSRQTHWDHFRNDLSKTKGTYGVPPHLTLAVNSMEPNSKRRRRSALKVLFLDSAHQDTSIYKFLGQSMEFVNPASRCRLDIFWPAHQVGVDNSQAAHCPDGNRRPWPRLASVGHRSNHTQPPSYLTACPLAAQSRQAHKCGRAAPDGRDGPPPASHANTLRARPAAAGSAGMTSFGS